MKVQSRGNFLPIFFSAFEFDVGDFKLVMELFCLVKNPPIFMNLNLHVLRVVTWIHVMIHTIWLRKLAGLYLAYHSGTFSMKKSHSTLRAKRATFAVKQCSQTCQFKRTKISWKCQNSIATFWVIFKHCDDADFQAREFHPTNQ